MNILLINALPLSHQGGAEISLKHYIQHRPRDMEIVCCPPDSPPVLDGFDGVILANLRPSGGPGEKAEMAWAAEWTQRIKDYRGWVIKSERDIHPCAHRDGRCIITGPIRKQRCDCSRLIPKAFERLYNRCDAVQFLSPAHQQVINQLVSIHVRQYVIAPPVDFDLFRSIVPFDERRKAALILGDAVRVSATAEARALDSGYPSERVPYQSVPYHEMPDLLNRYQAVVVDPVMFHAFGRLAVEALACGCRVLASDRVGSFSWQDPLKACRESGESFWKMVAEMKKSSRPSILQRLGRKVLP